MQSVFFKYIAKYIQTSSSVFINVPPRQGANLANPCHLVLVVQVYLLAAPPSPSTHLIFSAHLGLLSGALQAVLFPVTNTYRLAREVALYWGQHLAMLLLPLLLASRGPPYTPHSLPPLRSSALAFATFFLYHMLVLQPLALATGMNLGYVLCPPASSLPLVFGQHYILAALVTQALAITTTTTLYSLLLLRSHLTPHQASGAAQAQGPGGTARLSTRKMQTIMRVFVGKATRFTH